MLLGVLAFFFGIFVAMPVTLLATVEAYRRLSDAATASAVPQPLTGGEKTLAIVGVGVPALLIVVGILASILLASLSVAREKGSTAMTTLQLKQLQLGLELYFDDNKGTYPSSLQETAKYIQPDSSGPNSIPYEAFTYTPSKGNLSYQLCATEPVAQGQSQCVTSSPTTSATTTQK